MSVSQNPLPPLALGAWTKFERLLQANGVQLKDVLYEDGSARMDIIRSVNSGTSAIGKKSIPSTTKKPSSVSLSPLEVALISAHWNRLVPPRAPTVGGARKEADQANGAVAVPGGYLVEPTHVRPHQNTSTDTLVKSFAQYVTAGSAAPALSVASEVLQRDSSVLARQLQEYLPHITITQMQEVMGVKAPTAATLTLQ